MPKHHRLLLPAILLLFTTIARAQTGPDLLLKPFPENARVETNADAFFFDNNKTSDGFHIHPQMYDASGRIRLLPDEDADPRIGFDFNDLTLHSSDPALPGNLVDVSGAVGVGIASYNGWLAGVILGGGFAGNGYAPDSRAYYGKGDLIVGRELNSTDSIGIGLDYDGSRSFMPDVPLPGFGWRRQYNPTLQTTVGFPYSDLNWKPTDKLTIDANFYFPDDIEGRIDYKLPLHLGAFFSYDGFIDSYQLASLPPDKRLFFQQQRFQLGLNWTPKPLITALAAVGYAFDQRFDTGFDERRTDSVAKLGDRPFFRIGLEMRF